MENTFTEQDKEKVINFLNMVASKAEFKFNTKETIEYFKLLSYMQQQLLPKIEKHYLQIEEVIEKESK